MDKDDYILRSISKLPHKKWELFIITRIVHSILDNDCDIEFVCQQLVRRPGGGFGLTDIYFPQFGIHLEIDEKHHDANQLEDRYREKDIADATGHTLLRIKTYHAKGSLNNERIYKNLNDVIADTDNFITMIFERRKQFIEAGKWDGWNFGEKFNPERYIKLGHLDLADSPVFRTHRDALRCFGYAGGNYQRATWAIKGYDKKVVWFPKFYKNENWDNSISEDGQTIRMTAVGGEIAKNFDGSASFKNETAVAFAHYTDALGITLYRYLGEFQQDPIHSKGLTTVLNRTSTRTAL